MARGTVKWFNPTKGYGFIQAQGGGRDVFVHISAVERAGLTTLNEGQQVEYENRDLRRDRPADLTDTSMVVPTFRVPEAARSLAQLGTPPESRHGRA